MWAPTSSAEVDRALAADTLPETVVFDGKATLPYPRNPSKNLDIATDVAAFAKGRRKTNVSRKGYTIPTKGA